LSIIKAHRSLINTLLFIALTSLFVPLIAQEGNPLSRAEMEEDLAHLTTALLEVHPGLNYYESSRELPTLIAKIRESLPETASQLEFLYHIAPIIDATKCGHTGFNIKSRKKTLGLFQKDIPGLFPLQLKIVEGFTFVKKNLSTDTLGLRDQMQLLTINGIAIDEILLLLSNLNLGSDGNNRLGEINFITKYFMLAYHMFFGPQEGFVLELRDLVNKKVTKVNIASGSLKDLRQRRLDRYPALGLAPIQLRRIEGMPKSAVLDVNTFTNNRIDLFQLGYNRKIKKIFKILKKEEIAYLIMDLRNNPGGVVENVVRLMKYTYDEPFAIAGDVSLNRDFFKSEVGFFKKMGMRFRRKKKQADNIVLKRFSNKRYKPKKRNRFDGMIIILVDEGSFSAACTYALHAKSRNRAFLIGEEAGGSYHIVSAGDSFNCKLKNADISVRIPLMLFEYNVQQDLQSKLKGVVPNIIKHQKIEDFMNGKDTQMEAAVELVRLHQQREKE
jgi:hypothetical protein